MQIPQVPRGAMRGRGRGRGMPMPMHPGMRVPAGAMPMGAPMFSRSMQVNFAELQQKYGVDPKRWRCVYPCYLNKKKTKEEGRKVAKKYCVEGPHPQDITEACRYLGLPCYVELNKKHPRDFWSPSRVRVLLKKADDSLYREDIPNVRSLLVALGKTIPKLESRERRLEQQKKIRQMQEERMKQRIAEQKKLEEAKKHKTSKQKKLEKKRQQKNQGGRRGKGRGGRRGKGRKRRN